MGDRLLITRAEGHEPVRDGEIIQVMGPLGAPPYLVRWADTGRTSLIYPGPDARVVHYEHAQEAEPDAPAERRAR